MIKRKSVAVSREDKDKPVGPRPMRLHRSVVFETLPNAIVINEMGDGFALAAGPGDTLAVRRPRDGSTLTSVCTVMTIALGSEGVITCWDETLQQCFSFTPNDVAINDDVSVRTVPPGKVTRL